jgi:hypothetical protein
VPAIPKLVANKEENKFSMGKELRQRQCKSKKKIVERGEMLV